MRVFMNDSGTVGGPGGPAIPFQPPPMMQRPEIQGPVYGPIPNAGQTGAAGPNPLQGLQAIIQAMNMRNLQQQGGQQAPNRGLFKGNRAGAGGGGATGGLQAP